MSLPPKRPSKRDKKDDILRSKPRSILMRGETNCLLVKEKSERSASLGQKGEKIFPEGTTPLRQRKTLYLERKIGGKKEHETT